MKITKFILIIFWGLVLISCKISKHFRVENQYKVITDSISIEKQLVHQSFYDKKGVKEKEIAYLNSPSMAERTVLFNSEGNKIYEITYYDSAKSYGTEFLYEYLDNNLNRTIGIY